MPSLLFVGGIRMSVRTASGVEGFDRRQQLVAVLCGAHELDLVAGGEQRGCPFAHQVVILREHHSDHARMVHGPIARKEHAA